MNPIPLIQINDRASVANEYAFNFWVLKNPRPVNDNSEVMDAALEAIVTLYPVLEASTKLQRLASAASSVTRCPEAFGHFAQISNDLLKMNAVFANCLLRIKKMHVDFMEELDAKS